MANKLTLVNNSQLSEILNYIKDENTLKKATASPEEVELLESHKKVKDSVRKGSSLVESDKVNFQNKRKKYRDYVKQQKETTKGDDGETPAPRELKGKELIRGNVEQFFRNNGVRRTQNGIRIGDKTLRINYADLVNDLITDNRATEGNLTDAQLQAVLHELNELNFPVGNIRSKSIKKKYKQIKEAASKRKQTPPSRRQPTPPIGYRQRPPSPKLRRVAPYSRHLGPQSSKSGLFPPIPGATPKTSRFSGLGTYWK